MKDILQILNGKFEDKYAYLRIGKVDISTSDKRANIIFLMPEEVFDYSFNSQDVEAIVTAVKETLGNAFKVNCKFEKIILSEEIFKNALIEYMEKYFPLIAANIDYSGIKIGLGETATICMSVPENIHKYMPTVSFEERIRAFAQERFVLSVKFAFDIVPDEIRTKAFEANQANRYGRTVQVTDKRILFGRENELSIPAVHISTLRGDGQDVACCGKVKFLKYNIRDESKRVPGKKFYKNYYTFSISDTTGHLNVFINLDGEVPLLKDGEDVICRGRVNLRDDMSSFGMYARAVALCTIPYEIIREQTKPLAPPDRYSILVPKPYEEVVYSQLTIGMDDRSSEVAAYLDSTVTVAIRTIKTERAYVPYEVAMCFVKGKSIVEYVHTFLKVNFTEKSERAQYANSKGYASPRFSSVIPDLVKFAEGKTLVAVNPQFVIDLLNGTAKPLRYVFSNEIRAFSDVLPTSGGQRSALDEAIDMAKILLGKAIE